MQVLWWLVPPLLATAIAMGWVSWVGRERDDDRDQNSDEALARMQRALSRPPVRTAPAPTSRPLEPTHGVAVRRERRPAPVDTTHR